MRVLSVIFFAASASIICNNVFAVQYPCRTVTIFALDMSSNVGTLQDQTMFHKQLDLVSQAYHRWNLGYNDVMVGIPTPNGALNGGNFELLDDIPTIDDVLTNIKSNDDTAFQQSSLPLQLVNIANQFFWSEEHVEGVDYNIVLFTGSRDATEIANATEQRRNLLDMYDIQLIVVTLYDNQPQELQDLQKGGIINIKDVNIYFSLTNDICKGEIEDLQKGGIINIKDVNIYFSLTNDICKGEIEGDPTNIPTPVSVPAFPGNVDIFVQFSAKGCPNPINLNDQIIAIQHLFQNYTFEEDGVRAAIPNPIGMSSVGNDLLLYTKESVLQTIKTVESFSKLPDFCSKAITITNSLQNIQSLLRIKENSAAAMIFFSDSTDVADIAVAANYRQQHLDPINFLLIPVQLPGGASLSILATNKNQTFGINEYDLGKEITDALQTAKPFINATRIGGN
uniref:VWFA domain-containing protein n=1 Tax=Panagrolaimus sp. ES5 TaxID=591445 RepID=A0AC34F3V4_9BILA